MITIFNRKKLFTDSDPMELANNKVKLTNAKIPFIVNTIKFSGYTSRFQSLRTAAATNYANAASDNTTYVYEIYVRRKDYEEARRIIEM